jgi:hypothetical protein
MRTPLGGVIGRMTVKPKHPEDDVIDDDLILVWGGQRRIITEADLLGWLLRGIATQEETKIRLVAGNEGAAESGTASASDSA